MLLRFTSIFKRNNTNSRLYNQNSLLSARFSLIITTFAISEPPQNSTKKKRGTTGYVQQLIIKELNIPRMFG